MRKRRVFLTFASLALAASADASVQQAFKPRSGIDAFSAIGSIVRVTGTADQRQIKRNGQAKPVEALLGEFLNPGDEIVVVGQGVVVEALIQGSSTAIPITERNSPYKVGQQRQLTIPQAIRGFLAAITWPWAKRNPIARTPTQVRGENEGPRTIRPIAPVTPPRSATAQTIAIPADQDHLTINWCGDASYAEVYAKNRAVGDLIDEGRVGRLHELVNNASDQVRIFNRADTRYLEFNIKRVDRASLPHPDWIEPTRPSDAMTRTAWGVWLLTKGPAEYRFFGLTLIDDEKLEVAAAAQFFGAAVDCGE